MSEAIRLSTMLRDLVDVLIPGEEDWPSGSLAGIHGVLAMRLLQELGEDGPAVVDRALAAAGGPLDGLDEAGRVAVVTRFEQAEPRLFALVRTAAYYGYYESPAVIHAIRALGQPYQAVPIVKGYELAPFDLAHDRPKHNRGHYIPTDQVRPIDHSGLAHLETSHGKA